MEGISSASCGFPPYDVILQPPSKENSFAIRMIAIGSETKATAITKELLDVGFYISVTFFPIGYARKAGIRVCITADHEESDIERLCDCIFGCSGRSNRKASPSEVM